MESKFFFIMRANVYDPPPQSGSPQIMFQGDPEFCPNEHFAITFARSMYLKGGYDVVIVYGGNWDGSVHQLYRADRYADGSIQMPRGYAAAIARSAGDASDVLQRLLDAEVTLRS